MKIHVTVSSHDVKGDTVLGHKLNHVLGQVPLGGYVTWHHMCLERESRTSYNFGRTMVDEFLIARERPHSCQCWKSKLIDKNNVDVN